ncbi:carbohydrate kinase [Arthrobacter sp. MYb23]|uniref:carbohydrate kinase family protein n=1 Tax=unclassified Arthrobacter TaxID=235627 RepID=UPI000CFE006D|nr:MULTISPECIES: carbohydrate kinase [unclassified Arthrobacter]PRB43373.1 carbohydrate kinase [Arthrobacter sp. MYb51]PRB96971.1 carbohydrate kinase [Arthrobacter sp. MYb23]
MVYLNTVPDQPHPELDVMVVGEALIDVVTTGSRRVEHPGGSPANVAYGLARLGVTTGLLTAIGPDAWGRRIEEHLTGAGVVVLPGSQSLARTASATATVTADGSAHYDFDISWDLAPQAPAFFPKILHTGSIATFLDPGAGVVKSLLGQAKGHCVITYDPNIRPDLLGSHAEAKAIFEDLVAFTDVVKLSDEDAQWLYPGMSIPETAAHILGLGTGLTVITKGAEGSYLSTPGLDVTVPAVKTSVADTIGAGDSFMSALILGLLKRETEGFAPGVLEELGRTAVAAAAITVQRPGANPPNLEELNGLLESQRVG